MNEFHVHGDPAHVDRKICLPFPLHRIRDRESGEPSLDLHLCHDVLPVVLFEQLPFFRVVSGIVPRPPAVGLRGFARRTEVPDQSLACGQLLLVFRKPQGPACRVQSCRVSAVKTVEHRASPLRRDHRTKDFRQARKFKGRIIGMFEIFRIRQRVDDLLGNLFPACKIHYLHRLSVQ